MQKVPPFLRRPLAKMAKNAKGPGEIADRVGNDGVPLICFGKSGYVRLRWPS